VELGCPTQYLLRRDLFEASFREKALGGGGAGIAECQIDLIGRDDGQAGERLTGAGKDRMPMVAVEVAEGPLAGIFTQKEAGFLFIMSQEPALGVLSGLA
jgi:hypothetical protein